MSRLMLAAAVLLGFAAGLAAEDGKKKNDKSRDEQKQPALPPDQEMLMQATFGRMDADRDGQVTAAEAASFFRGKGAKPVDLTPELSDENSARPSAAKTMDAVFLLSYDKDRDGAVSLQEYRQGWAQEFRAAQKQGKNGRNQENWTHQRILAHMRNNNLIREFRGGRRIP